MDGKPTPAVALSSEVGTGSRQDNASKKIIAVHRFA
jgi:hypothetical protein